MTECEEMLKQQQRCINCVHCKVMHVGETDRYDCDQPDSDASKHDGMTSPSWGSKCKAHKYTPERKASITRLFDGKPYYQERNRSYTTECIHTIEINGEEIAIFRHRKDADEYLKALK